MPTIVAVPVSREAVCPHFGHCEAFALFRIDDAGEIAPMGQKPPPDHAPGVFPGWLRSQGVNVVLAGGMGGRALALFDEAGIKVVLGVRPQPAEDAVRAYADGSLETGDNVCSH